MSTTAWQRAFEAMTDGVIVVDLKAQSAEANSAARLLLGIPLNVEISPSYLKDTVGFYPFELASSHDLPLREQVRIGDRVYHSVVTPLGDESGSGVAGYIIVLRDLGETPSDTRRKADFRDLVSKELRSPLTSIAGAIDIVLSGHTGAVAEKSSRYLEMARQAVAKMNLLVDQMVDLTEAEKGNVVLNTGPLVWDKLVELCIERYRDSASKKQITLTLVSTLGEPQGPARGRIVADAERLQQVVSNLLANSIKFAPLGGTVTVELFGPPALPDAVGLSVANEGDPISEEERERIFEPFAHSDRRIGGSGLGLAISRSIVEAHGGRIWVETLGSTTKFVLTLPVGVSAESGGHNLSGPVRATSRSEPLAILLCDADKHRALLLKGVLLAGGDTVHVAEDPDAALVLARKHRPHVAVVASVLPEFDALISIMRHDPDTRKIAILGLAETGRSQGLITSGANDVVELPITPLALRDACNRVAETNRFHARRVLVVDDDSASRTICRDVLEQAGFVVREANTVDKALQETRRFQPDLLVVDIAVPGGDGFALAARLRDDPTTKLTPMIFLAARATTADKIRAFRAGAEDFMVKPFDPSELIARAEKAVDRQARELGASPTTQLPGADAIEAEMLRHLGLAMSDHIACYLDLDNLKAFNDFYGYARADAVIRQTGALIRERVYEFGNPQDFIGHIAGDDFVFVTTTDKVDAIAGAICDKFDRLIPYYYQAFDRKRGYIETKDRWGVMRRFPLMSVSIAAVSIGRAGTYAGLAELAANGKKIAKSIIGSSYVREERVVSADVATSSQSARATAEAEPPLVATGGRRAQTDTGN